MKQEGSAKLGPIRLKVRISIAHYNFHLSIRKTKKEALQVNPGMPFLNSYLLFANVKTTWSFTEYAGV